METVGGSCHVLVCSACTVYTLGKGSREKRPCMERRNELLYRGKLSYRQMLFKVISSIDVIHLLNRGKIIGRNYD